MTDISRRGFFRLTAGAALTAVSVNVAAAVPDVPVLWGDGVHDDTIALQALLDGEVVQFMVPSMADGAGWSGSVLTLPKGRYLVSNTIVISCDGDFTLNGQGAWILQCDPNVDYAYFANSGGVSRINDINFGYEGCPAEFETPLGNIRINQWEGTEAASQYSGWWKA